MKGSIYLRTGTRYPFWIVSFFHKGIEYKFDTYPGDRDKMRRTHLKENRCAGHRKAEKLLAALQTDVEREARGEGFFTPEKYQKERYTDVVPYLKEWLEARQPTLTPGGFKKYKTAVNVHLIPFFTEFPVQLHEIRYDVLVRLLNWVKGSGRNKWHVLTTLHTCMVYAWRSNRISHLPPFPERKLYDLHDKPVVWLPSDRQEEVIRAIPREHQPIFWFLKYHLRRPGEAMALHKSDYDPSLGAFIIRRGISNETVIERTKTGDCHMIPAHQNFKPFVKERLERKVFPPSPFMFINPDSHMEGQRYTGKQLIAPATKHANLSCCISD